LAINHIVLSGVYQRNLGVTATSPMSRGPQPDGYMVTPVTPIFFKKNKNISQKWFLYRE